jgi:ribosomal protection tetracycline resistance protein
MSIPYLRVQAYPESDDLYPRLVEAFQGLADEDPALDVEWVQDKKELNLKIMGLIQMEILSSILMERFNLNVRFSKASVIYKETPSRAGEGFVSYTMPKPCWAVLRFMIEPGERGSGVQYSSVVRTEYILERYQKQVEKTIPKALEQGLYGWEVTDIKITLIDGEYHVEHTRPPDFAVATPMGIMDGLAYTGTTLLEPVLKFSISAPEDASGRILNDLVQMRGTFDSPLILNGAFNVEGIVPAATSMDYHIRLASMTGGRGTITTTFSGYRECSIENGATAPRKGVNPLDRAKYILYARNAILG